MKYYLWVNGVAKLWYVCRVNPEVSPEKGFEAYFYKLGAWHPRDDYRAQKNKEGAFYENHMEIDEETAAKCILAGPDYCLALQKEIS